MELKYAGGNLKKLSSFGAWQKVKNKKFIEA